MNSECIGIYIEHEINAEEFAYLYSNCLYTPINADTGLSPIELKETSEICPLF